MMKIGSLLFCFLVALTNGAPLEGGSGACPDGTPNGALVDRGSFYFECRSGQFVPRGCYGPDMKRLEAGGNFDKREYRLRCNLQGDQLSLDAVACLLDGQEHKVDETFDNGKNVYTCKPDGNGLKLVTLGCVEGGKRVNLKETTVKGDLVLTCEESVNNGAKLVPTGCVKNGKQINAGDSTEEGKYWYTCKKSGRETVTLEPSGCVASGKRLNDGDRFTENELAYECMVDSGKVDVRVVACVQNDNGNPVDRKIGCTWIEGQAPFQYTYMCMGKDNLAEKVQLRCTYQGTYNINPGCYRVVEKAAFGCVQSGAKLQLQSFQGEKAEDAARSAGLHEC